MKTRHETIWSNSVLQSATAPLSQQVFGNSVCGIRIQNRTVWVMMITETATGAPVDELPPLSWVLIPNPLDFTLALLVASNNLTKPADMRVSVTYVDTPVTYAYGTISPLSGQSIPGQLVQNDVSAPVNNNPVQGSPVTTGQISLPSSGALTLIMAAGGVMQKLLINVMNGTNATTPANAIIQLRNGSNGSDVFSQIPVGNLESGAVAPPLEIDFAPGIENNGIYGNVANLTAGYMYATLFAVI